jgi:DNA processing protein
MDQVTMLRLAIAGSRYGRGDVRLAARVRKLGVVAFTDVLDALGSEDQDRIAAEAEALAARGVSAALLGVTGYPSLLSKIRDAPPSLFYLGSSDLLTVAGIGMCGSRNASDEGIRAAAACSQVAAEHGLAVTSGYARGVDMEAHVSALAAGGTTVIVLPEGIDRFRIKRGPLAQMWDSKRVLVISQFSPDRPWSAGSAMARNSVIIGISRALVVVEANEQGGSFAAGTRALEANRTVIALAFDKLPNGNAILMQRGAISVRNRTELARRLTELTGPLVESTASQELATGLDFRI